MTDTSFATSFEVDRTPDEVFKAITDVRGWWTGEVAGGTERLGDEFTYRYADLHSSRQRVTDLVPGRRVAWQVLDARLAFAGDPHEWAGTEIVFDIVPAGERTEVRFAHVGLVPELDCFDNCAAGWSFFIGSSLKRRITTGEGPTAPPWA